jgi:hypothetical protein
VVHGHTVNALLQHFMQYHSSLAPRRRWLRARSKRSEMLDVRRPTLAHSHIQLHADDLQPHHGHNIDLLVPCRIVSLFSFSLCLSRACLGKYSFLVQAWLYKHGALNENAAPIEEPSVNAVHFWSLPSNRMLTV